MGERKILVGFSVLICLGKRSPLIIVGSINVQMSPRGFCFLPSCLYSDYSNLAMLLGGLNCAMKAFVCSAALPEHCGAGCGRASSALAMFRLAKCQLCLDWAIHRDLWVCHCLYIAALWAGINLSILPILLPPWELFTLPTSVCSKNILDFRTSLWVDLSSSESSLVRREREKFPFLSSLLWI